MHLSQRLEGDKCDKPVTTERLVRNTGICDDMPCQNGGTCISMIDETAGEAGMEMGETAIDGEATTNGEAVTESNGEAMLVCKVIGNCFSCVCTPDFTGPLCSVSTGIY